MLIAILSDRWVPRSAGCFRFSQIPPPVRRSGLICVVITTTIQLLSPWVLKFAIDDLTAGVTRRKLAFYSGTLLGIACVGAVFRYLMRKMLIGASREIEYDVRNAFFVRLQQMPLAYYQARRTGDLMSRATNDLNAVRMMIGPAVMYSANTILVFVVAIVLMLSLDTRLTLMALLPLPLVSISVRYFGAAIHKRFEAIQEQLANLSAIVQEALAGVRVVRAYNQEAHEIERFRAANLEFVRRNRVLIRLQGLFFPSMTLFLGFGSLLVLWLGSQRTSDPKHRKERAVSERTALQPDDRVAAHNLEDRARFVGFLVVGADHAHPRQRLLDDGAQIGELLLNGFEALVDGRTEVADADRDERQRQQRHQRQARVERHISTIATTNTRMVLAEYITAGADHHAHGVEIVGRARHQVAGPPRLVVGERHLLQPHEERVTEHRILMSREAPIRIVRIR